ncbi:MAG TPA: hypothetical protein DCP63_07525 [Bacteroidetes bacterium]|nr:hypothetical protein [Bacteroidota bacterium]
MNSSLHTILTPLLMFWLSGSALPEGNQQDSSAYFAAVYFNRGSTAVGTLGDIGLFRKREGDTLWINLRPNTITPGVAFAKYGGASLLYLAGGNGLHRSADRGKSWKVLTGWQTNEILSVALHPTSSSILYISTPFGVFKSTDGGEHWGNKMRGFKSWYIRQVKIDLDVPESIYAIDEETLYRSVNGGEKWSALNVGVQGVKCFLQHPVDHDILLVGTEDHGIRISLDRGKRWRAAQGLPSSPVYALRSSQDGKQIYAAGYQTGVWKSEDRGRSWTNLWLATGIDAIYSLFVHPNNPDHIIVGTNGKGMFESLDRGATWRQAGLPFAHVKQIELYPN